MTEEEALRELYGSMQTFRGLGFPSDNLFVAFGVVAVDGPHMGKKCVGVVLRWLGTDFAYTVAPVKNEKKFAKRWVRFATAANEAPPDDPEFRRAFHSSYCRMHVTQLILALDAKGIKPPLGAN